MLVLSLSGECRKTLVQFGGNSDVNIPTEETETQFIIVLETEK